MPILKPQVYPASKIAVGSVLYSCTAWTDDAGKTVSEVNEWIVRSIQVRRGAKTRMGFARSFGNEPKQYVNITQKLDRVTWGKRSTKSGDFGWLKTIPSYFRKQFPVGGCLPHGIYTTIRAALLYEISSTKDLIARRKAIDQAERDDADNQELAEYEAQYVALKRRLEKLKSKPNTTSKPKSV